MRGLSWIPLLSYNVTRNITWPWLAPTAYALGAIAFIALIVLNVALTGYNVIVVKSDNFNTTQDLWYNRFSRPEKPGTRCSSYNFTVGEVVSTSNTLLEYTLLGTGSNTRTISYSGGNLDNCDVLYITIDADIITRTVHIVANVACNSTTFPIVLKSSFTCSWLLGMSTRAQAFPTEYAVGNRNSVVVNFLIDTVSTDLMNQMYTLVSTGVSPVTMISVWGVPYCSKVSSENITYWAPLCKPTSYTEAPFWIFDWYQGYMGTANGSSLASKVDNSTFASGPLYWSNDAYLSPNLTSTYLPGLINIMQLVHAAIQIDLGHIYPNNVILNNTMMPSTIFSSLPGYEEYYLNIYNTSTRWNDSIPDPGAHLNAQYDCLLHFPKSWGSGLVDVMVATLTFFKTGWGIALLIITWFATRQPGTKHCCEGHTNAQSAVTSPMAERREEEASLLSTVSPSAYA